MARSVAVGHPPIDVTLRRSARARRLTLRVSQLDGRVTLSVPRFVAEAEALRFARGREAWLRKALGKVAAPVAVGQGTVLPVEGEDIRIALYDRRTRTGLEQGVLRVRPDRPGAAVQAFLKARARDRLVAASDRYAAALGASYKAVTLRDTRSRWGSCTSDMRLMYSWRLIMAPPAVLDYVAAHEVAHLRHMDHSPAFWAVVAELCPDHAQHREWLRDNGPALHRYVFRD